MSDFRIHMSYKENETISLFAFLQQVAILIWLVLGHVSHDLAVMCQIGVEIMFILRMHHVSLLVHCLLQT